MSERSAPPGLLSPHASSSSKVASQLPEPGRLWIRYRPRRWPSPEGFWTDVARGALGQAEPGAEMVVAGPLDDVLYLPPVTPAQAPARAGLVAERQAEGTPVVVQLAPGEAPPPPPAVAAYDLLPALLDGDLEALGALPPEAVAIWPLIAGLTDEPEMWRRGCRRLAGAGVRRLQAVELNLTPACRRRLAEGRSAQAFHALFHRPPAGARELARTAHACGLTPFVPRPLPRPPLSARNRRLAGELILAAELWLTVGRPVGRGLALSRAARWVDGSPYDVEALCREGNLGVIEEIETETRRLVEEWVATGRLALLDALLAEYVAAEEG